MERTLNSETKNHLNEEVKIAGWVQSIRSHGKIIFIDLRDRSGIAQVVFTPKDEIYNLANELKPEWAVEITGRVNERPEGMKNPNLETGGIEIKAEKLAVLSKTEEEFPFDLSQEPNFHLDTLLDNRPITLRYKKNFSILKILETVLQSYREAMRNFGFTEIKSPKITGLTSEGGANVFELDYFGKKAYLAQSPQLYKQIGVSIFERVFEVGPVFRKEPHFTTRHLNEYISLDAEMGFISGFGEIMDELEKAVKFIFEKIKEKNQKELKLFSAEISDSALKTEIPRLELAKIKKIIREKYNYEIPGETEINPKGERLAGQYAKEKFGSDFLFLTHYPTEKRPFYTMPDPENPEKTNSFDLLYKGLEIATGGQRIHNYRQLIDNMEKFGLNPEDFKSYLQAFKYGMPPHGGWGIGSERIVYKLLGLPTIKEVPFFPRDVRRLEP